MTWTPLAGRLDKLPLVLAGPILRRVEPGAVTVWVALKRRCSVALTVWEWDANGLGETKLLSARTTTKLGTHLHVVAVTAVTPPGLTPLEWGKLYCYNLFFDPPLEPGTGRDLFGPEVLVAEKDPVKAKAAAMKLLTYTSEVPNAPTLPSFALPPVDINQLHVVHGSCRKPDSEGGDALPALDVMISRAAADPIARPHLLFLTGDQIYADGVADTLLTLLSDAGDCLLAWDEALPDVDPSRASELMAGQRAKIAHEVAHLTSGYDMKSHLLKLGEFYAMYLFAWSDVLWPTALPGFDDVYPDEVPRRAHAIAGSAETKLYSNFSKELKYTEDFRASLPSVRRGLANVPTYMIFDDHEVTDDWYQDLDWNLRVLARPLGRRVLQNALLAYAVFQGWGNTPEQFEEGGNEPGWYLLDAASRWQGAADDDEREIARRLRIPARNGDGTTVVVPGLNWHYSVAGPKHRAIVLDTRTWRHYPGALIDPPALISDDIIDLQIASLSDQEAAMVEVYLVVSPVPVVMIPLDETIQKRLGAAAKQSEREWIARVADPEGWALQSAAFESLVTTLATRLGVNANGEHRARILFLSGDVHRGYAARFQHWATAPFARPGATPVGSPINVVFAQLTSSGFKNEAFIPQHFFHTHGYIPGRNALPPSYQWAGWNIPPGGDTVTIGTEYTEGSESGFLAGSGEGWEPYKLRDVPAMFRFSPASVEIVSVKAVPDWLHRIDFMLGESVNRPFTPESLSLPGSPQPSSWWLETSHRIEKAHRDYARKWGAGKEVVGHNNIGEITLQWGEGDNKTVTQELWWRLGAESRLEPLTKYVVSLRFDDPTYPKPQPPVLP